MQERSRAAGCRALRLAAGSLARGQAHCARCCVPCELCDASERCERGWRCARAPGYPWGVLGIIGERSWAVRLQWPWPDINACGGPAEG
jgi:hypothetical protein